jgi:hypothetical protein
MAATEVPDLIGDPAALADLQVGGVQPEIGPLAVERAFQEGAHALVDVLAELGDPRLREGRLWDFEMPVRPMAWTRSSTRRVDTPAIRSTGLPSPCEGSGLTLDDGHQRLLGRPPRFEEGRKVAPLPEL